MIVASITRIAYRVSLFAALGVFVAFATPSWASDPAKISDVSGKRIKLYTSDSDRKAAERVSADDVVGSPVTGHTSRRIRIEFGGKAYWVDAYKVTTQPPLSLKSLPADCAGQNDGFASGLAMTSDSHGYTTARGSGQSGGCN